MNHTFSINTASIPVRVLTHRNQRKLTNDQVLFLVMEYVNTEATYKVLSQKYGIAERTVSNIIRGITYRGVVPAELLKQAQAKAAESNARFSNGAVALVPDPTKTVIEVDLNSVESIDAELLRLLSLRSALIRGSCEEVLRSLLIGCGEVLSTA